MQVTLLTLLTSQNGVTTFKYRVLLALSASLHCRYYSTYSCLHFCPILKFYYKSHYRKLWCAFYVCLDALEVVGC